MSFYFISCTLWKGLIWFCELASEMFSLHFLFRLHALGTVDQKGGLNREMHGLERKWRVLLIRTGVWFDFCRHVALLIYYIYLTHKEV